MSGGKYFKEAWINGHHCKAYVDFGSWCNILKHSKVKSLGLGLDSELSVVLKGYGNVIVHSLSSTKFRLRLDSIEEEIDAEVVPDANQNIDLLIGQPFTELPGLVMSGFKKTRLLYAEIL